MTPTPEPTQDRAPSADRAARDAALARSLNARGAQPDVAQEVARAGTGRDGPRSMTVIEEPAKIMRIGEMIKRLLEEVRGAPLDEAARVRLAEVHERSLVELEEGLSPDLVAELHRITLPFTDDVVPSEAELRIAQAQLVGWLEGLFHGLQTALVAQQIAAQAQLQGRALGPGTLGGLGPDAGTPGGQAPDGRPTPGQYL